MKQILFLVLFLASGCADLDVQPNKYEALELQNPFGNWQFVSYQDNVNVDSSISLELKNEVDENGFYLINGKSVVNFYLGSYSIDFQSKEFKIENLSRTKIEAAATSQLQKQEDAYLDKLANIESYELLNEGERLKLYTDKEKGEFLIFDKL